MHAWVALWGKSDKLISAERGGKVGTQWEYSIYIITWHYLDMNLDYQYVDCKTETRVKTD